MKKVFMVVVFMLLLLGMSYAQLTFYLIDNFEEGSFSNKWYVFDAINASVVNNPGSKEADSIAEACGERSLQIKGKALNWYAGGMGTVLDVNASDYSRFLVDVYGNKNYGKIKVEIFEKKDNLKDQEIKWVVELPILGTGFTRYSIPFSAFNLDNPKEVIFHPNKGGQISKIQIIFIGSSEKSNVEAIIDNLMFTF